MGSYPKIRRAWWPKIAEILLAILASQCLDRRMGDIETLATEAGAWAATRNQTATTVNWRFTTANARIKLRHLYPSHEA
jgi:hypothetical protein